MDTEATGAAAMNCLRCNEPMPDLAPGVEQPSGICCECFGTMYTKAMLESEYKCPTFINGFEAGMAAMRQLLDAKGAGT